MDKRLLRKLVLEECGCMARDVELPASMSAMMPMLSILGYNNNSSSGARSHEDEQERLEFEDSDDHEESSMVKGNLYNIAQQAQELHDVISDDDDLPEWVQEKIAVATEMLDVIYDYLHAEIGQDNMREAKKHWYMKKRMNMKKTNDSEWYDIKKTKKKIDEDAGPGAVKPPQNTKSGTVLPSHDDEGKPFTGVSSSDDKDSEGKPLGAKRLGEFDIYKSARNKDH